MRVVLVQAVGRLFLIAEARVRSAWDFVVDGLARGQVFLGILQFSPVSVITPMLHIHSFIYH